MAPTWAGPGLLSPILSFKSPFHLPLLRFISPIFPLPDYVLIKCLINLINYFRRDRNSAIIRKSLALDDDPFATALSHSPYSRHLGGQSHNRQSGDVSMTSSAATVARVTSFRESGKGHHFRFEADDPAQVLWCDICGEAIFSLLYRAIRCESMF